jgi:hypothetical protein
MRILTSIIAATAFALSGCAQSSPSTRTDNATSQPPLAVVEPAAGDDNQLPLPQIPDSMTDPAQRAVYVVTHFWDSMDFANTAQSLDTAFIEQNFANFASLFPVIDIRTVLPQVAKSLMNKAEANRDAYNLLAETADKYLYDPNSPMLNEEAYIPFLEAITEGSFVDNALRARYEAHLEDACKNRVGTTARDFDIIFHSGATSTLLKECRGAKAAIILFYDPECGNCARLVHEMNSDGALTAAIVSGRVKIIAVYPDGDADEFAASAGKIPARWTDAMSIGGKVSEEEIYSLRAMPSVYLLDGNGTVILKDADAGEAVATALSM